MGLLFVPGAGTVEGGGAPGGFGSRFCSLLAGTLGFLFCRMEIMLGWSGCVALSSVHMVGLYVLASL